MAWSPTNLNQHTDKVDSILHIKGLAKLLQDLVPDDAYCNLNLCVNGLRQQGKHKLSGYNLYVLGIWFEVFDDDWFYQIYIDNPQANFLILTDLDARDLQLLPRVTVINLLQWKYWYNNYTVPDVDWTNKTYKISSLSNRITQYRYYVTAALLRRTDVFFTWNYNQVPGNHHAHIYGTTGWPRRDQLLAQCANKLNQPINAEIFVNDPAVSLNLSSAHPAYANSLVNSINENKDVTWTANLGFGPGPYMTEKTWKPLMSGCALLFSGAYGTKHRLEQIGFAFDYPWSNDYDQITGDLERLEQILNTIDTILDMSHQHIITHIQSSIEHNQNILINGQVSKYIDQVNQQGFDLLTKYFK